MVDYLNPYLYGNYLEEEPEPFKGTKAWTENAVTEASSPSFVNVNTNTNPPLKKPGWFKQNIVPIYDELRNNQGLQNAAFGLVNSFIQPVNSSSEENAFFATSDALSKELKGEAGLATKAALAALKVINSAGGKRTLDFSINRNAINPVIGSYNDSSTLFTDASSKAGLKFSVVNDREREKIDAMIREAKRQQNIITGIARENEDLLAMQNNMNYNNYINNLNGGLDLNYYRIAKLGMKFKTLDRIKNLNFNSKKLKKGGFIEYKEWTPTIISEEINFYQQGGSLNTKNTNRSIELLITYAKEQNPRFIQRMSEPLRYVKVNFKDNEGRDAWEHSTHIMTNKGNIVFPLVLEDPQGKLFIFNDPEKALNWATLNNNVLTFDTEEEAVNFKNNYKQGWNDFFNTSPLDITPEAEYEEYEPYKYRLLNNTNEQFKEGGKLKEETKELKEETNQKNVIPEGALHKNKHHMENTDGLTLKGIPVVDNDGDQLAEIECNELILNLENTKFIEERYKKYYSDELTQKEKDQLAVEIGELLVQEILHNTDDRTGLIDKVE